MDLGWRNSPELVSKKSVSPVSYSSAFFSSDALEVYTS